MGPLSFGDSLAGPKCLLGHVLHRQVGENHDLPPDLRNGCLKQYRYVKTDVDADVNVDISTSIDIDKVKGYSFS